MLGASSPSLSPLLVVHGPSCLPLMDSFRLHRGVKKQKEASPPDEVFSISSRLEDYCSQFFFFFWTYCGIRRSDSSVFSPTLSTDLIYFMVLAALGLVTSFLPQPWLLPSLKWEESRRLCRRSAELVFKPLRGLPGPSCKPK